MDNIIDSIVKDKLASVRNPSFAMNNVAMLSLVI